MRIKFPIFPFFKKLFWATLSFIFENAYGLKNMFKFAWKHVQLRTIFLFNLSETRGNKHIILWTGEYCYMFVEVERPG